LHVRVWMLQGRTREAEAFVKKYEQKPGHDPRALAALYEEVGQAALAEALYQRLVKEQPDARDYLALAEFLGRQGRIDDALAWCERAAKAGALPPAASLAIAVLQAASQRTPEQLQRADKLLNEALLKYPEAPALLTPLASLRNLQGNYRETEAAYRKILEHQGRDITVLNNLAFLLAFRTEKASEALGLINRALDLAGPLPDLLDTRALIYLRLGTSHQAQSDLDMAI